MFRAGLAIVFILGLAGFAAGVIPQACRSGLMSCDGKVATESLLPVEPAGSVADAAPTPSPSPQGGGELTAETSEVEAPADASSAAPAIETAMVRRQPATLTANDLVARTFDALDTGLVTTPGELSTRTVRTVAIGADGQPVAEASAAADVAPLVPEEPAEVATEPAQEQPAEEPPAALVEQPSSEPVQVAEASSEAPSEDVGATAYAPVGEGNAVVTGKGANVRSLPQKGGSQVLFALAGGEEVTVVEMSKGWAKIVDARGRNGWIYGDYLRR